MTNKKNKRKKPSDTSDDSTTSSNTTLDEEDVLKIIRRLKLDLNNPKNPLSFLIKSYFNKLKGFLDDLVKNGQVESYDTFGGYRYGYLLVNDLNIDFLVKIKNKDDFKNVLNYFKTNLDRLHFNFNENKNTERKDSYDINLYMYNNLNTNNNLLSKVLVISFNHKKSGRELKFKLYFTIVKYDLKNNIRKTNINEYILKELDEINNKYTNISNAIILLKLFLHTFNLSPFPLNSNTSNSTNKTSTTTSNNKDNTKKLSERKFAVSELNGYVFNLILTHMCVVNNYSYDTKAVILFKNTLSYMCNTYKKLNTGKDFQDFVLLYCNSTSTSTNAGTSARNSEQEVENNNTSDNSHLLLKKEFFDNELGPKLFNHYQQLVSKEFERKLVMMVEKYPKVNLLEQIHLVLPQLNYYFEIGLNILNSKYLSKNDKMIQLLLRKNRLSNFYENCLTYKCYPEEVKLTTEQLVFLLKYGLKDRLHLVHFYYIHTHHLVHTYNTTTSNTDSNSSSTDKGSTTNTEQMEKTNPNSDLEIDECNEEDYHVMMYFTFNNDVQTTEDFGPSYTPSNLTGVTTSNSNNKHAELEKRLLENEFYKMFWGDRCQLVKTNNRIQYSVDLELLGLSDNYNSSTTNKTSTTTGISRNNKGSDQNRNNQEERLFLEREELRGNINFEIVKHIEKRLLNKKLLIHFSNFNVKFPLINEQHKALVSTTNDFTDILRNLDESPLKILNTQVLCESYSYCNLYNFYNLYDYFNNQSVRSSTNRDSNSSSTNKTSTTSNTVTEKELEKKLLERDKVIRILIRWESSSKWPREEEAFNKVVMSLLLTISKELKNRFGFYTMMTQESLLVFYNNYLYEIIPLNTNNTSGSNSSSTNKTSTSTCNNNKRVELEKSETKEELERKYRLMEDCRNAVMTNLNFVGCVRLVKMFFSKHLKLDLEEFVKSLCLQIYDENNYIKSRNSTVQFLQLLYYISNSDLTDDSSSSSTDKASTGTGTIDNISNDNSSSTNNLFNLLNDYKLFSGSTRDAVVRCCRTVLREVNNNLVTLHMGNHEDHGYGDSRKDLNEKDGLSNFVDIEKLENLLDNCNNYNLVIELNNLYHFNKDQSSNSSSTNKTSTTNNNKHTELMREFKKYNSRDWLKCMLKYLKNNLNEVAEVYYYKYKLYNYFNTRSYKHLNLYLRFDKFKFVPKLHFKQRNYPQSAILVSTHLSHLARLKELRMNTTSGNNSNGNSSSTDKTSTTTLGNSGDNTYRGLKNNLVNTAGFSDLNTEHYFESIVENDHQYAIQNVQETVIIVPNVVLIMKMLTMVTSGALSNLVFL